MSKKSLVTLSGQSLFPKVLYESLTYNNYVLSEIVNRLINKTNAIENYLFNRYFYIENLSSSTNYLITLQKNGSPNDIELEFSNDNQQTWHTLSTSGINSISFDIPANGKVYLKGNNLTFSTSSSSYYTFNFGELHCNIGGKLMSLVGYNDITSYMFCHLFENNYNLISAENLILPDNVANNCYSCMFSGCSSLINAPKLPATTLADECYALMFILCTSLVNVPILPATTLAMSCYLGMFDSCTALIDAPALPATTLAIGCYCNMFSNCVSLVNAPELLATTLVDSCYACMFQGCTSLNYIKAMFTTTSSTHTTYNWLYNVASTGTFVKNADATWDISGDSGIPSGWTIQYMLLNPFYIENISSEDCLVTLTKSGSPTDITLDYSIDDQQTWNTLTTADNTSFTIPANGKVYLKGDNSTFSTSNSNYYTFIFDKQCNVGGKLISLVGGTSSIGAYMFYSLFCDNYNLISAENLILSNNLGVYCYYGMFQYCTSLIAAPTLPATTLVSYCYGYMFSGCTSLTTAPELPAITLINGCYQCMFIDCSSLNYVKAMFTNFDFISTILWLDNVSPTGTFVKNIEATWNETSSDGIPSGWTVETAAA